MAASQIVPATASALAGPHIVHASSSAPESTAVPGVSLHAGRKAFKSAASHLDPATELIVHSSEGRMRESCLEGASGHYGSMLEEWFVHREQRRRCAT